MRSLRNRLALLFALIVAAAIAFVYFTVLPRLEERLESQKVADLAKVGRQLAPEIAETAGTRAYAFEDLEDTANDAAAFAGAEVVVLVTRRGDPETLFTVTDSTPRGGVELSGIQPVARRAVTTRRVASGIEATRDGRKALAAVPIRRGTSIRYVVVFSDVLTDVQGNVDLIRRQVLGSGAIALVLAILAGYLLARWLAGRVKSLEQAVRSVASGDFSHPIVESGRDELGQLAVAFEDMQRQLGQLDRARKQFIAQASHELRTPIFSLGGFLELLADEELDEPTRQSFLAQIRGQVERLRKLTTELLDLSRLEAGALELRPEPTDVGQLAREVASEFTPAAARRGADVEIAMRGEPLEIECDPNRVAQVVRILLDNAMVHTPPGTPVRLSAGRQNGHVTLEVSDRGRGIERDSMAHIFEPFFTSDDDAHGAGLGLAIARELAERMDGELTVSSRPSATTFSLTLPA